jgi:hypothetical protein
MRKMICDVAYISGEQEIEKIQPQYRHRYMLQAETQHPYKTWRITNKDSTDHEQIGHVRINTSLYVCSYSSKAPRADAWF